MPRVNYSVINFGLGGEPPEYGISYELAESAASRGRFSYVPEDTPRQMKAHSVVFVVGTDQRLEYVGILKRSQSRVATAQRNFKAYSLRDTDPSPVWLELPEALRNRLSPYFQTFISHIPTKAADDLVDYLRGAFPEIADVLAMLAAELGSHHLAYAPDEVVQLQQRDAAATALALWGDDEEAFNVKSQSISDGGSFISSLRSGRILEDQLIGHDWGVFEDWVEADRSRVDSVRVFVKDGKELAIINANRDGIEHALGTDLVYIDENQRTVVFVQYKMMSETDANNQAYYSPNNRSHDLEIERMRLANTAIRNIASSNPTNDISSLRLSECAFYFKLCEVRNLEKSDSKIAKGMYVPLDFWEEFLISDDTDGPRGGKQFGYSKLQHRYLHATHFSQLFRDSLIGTTVSSWAEVSAWIKTLVEQPDKNTVIAVSKRIEDWASSYPAD